MNQRGRKTRPWRGHRGTRRPVLPATLAPPLGEIIATVHPEDLEDSASQGDTRAQITNSQYLTSYNWLSGATHHILVPGEPPAWTPLPKPVKLQEDDGQYYRDLNAARYPTYPLEPMIQAILTERPEFSLKDVDIIGCGSTLGNLLRFARGGAHSFRMLVEAVGNTVFFVRRENSPTEIIPDVRGFGHTFPEAYTTWRASVQGSESHQRLVNYDFAGMNCLVRFEVDGFLPDLIPDDFKDQKYHTSKTGGVTVDEILSSIQDVTISSVRSATEDAEARALKVSNGGDYIPQRAIFDLKTRSVKRMEVQTLEEEMPRLWIRQIPNFVLAYHTHGKFNDIRIQNVHEEMKRWEESEQPNLVRLASLLHMIVSFARSMNDGRFEIEHTEGEETLNFREPEGNVNSVLPASLASTWDSEDTYEASS